MTRRQLFGMFAATAAVAPTVPAVAAPCRMSIEPIASPVFVDGATYTLVPRWTSQGGYCFDFTAQAYDEAFQWALARARARVMVRGANGETIEHALDRA